MQPINVPDPTEREFEPVEAVPTAEYRAKLQKVEEKPNKFDPEKPQWLWTWRLTEPGFEDHPIWQFTSQKLGEFLDKETDTVKKSQARKNIEAILDRPLEPKEELSWETQIFGGQAILSITRYEKDGELKNKIAAVMPMSMLSVTTKGNVRPLPGVTPQANAPTKTTAALPESAGYLRRFEMARNTLQWSPDQVIDTIVAIVGVRRPFHILQVEQQKEILELMEAQAEAADIPFESPPAEEDELAAAGMPASTKHRVS